MGESDDVLLVFAAASLADAMEDLAAEFETVDPGVEVDINVAGSSSLREQILAGAPADVFAAASPDVVKPLREAGEVSTRGVVFATNSLVVGVPSGNPGDVTGLESFTDGDLLLGACAPGVPCGDLAAEAFGLAEIDPALDTEEPNVRALLSKIRSGDLDAGLVYVTDVEGSDGEVESLALPEGAAASNPYPAVVLDRADDADAAEAFVDFLLSEAAQRILAEHGFGGP
jgi:molybdate transport system substrate-binding protein